MSAQPRIGVLLSEQTSGEQVSLITFYPEGVLGFSLLTNGLHVFALKPLERLLRETAFPQPLYNKYAELLQKDSALPADILEREANSCAEVLNREEPPLIVGNRRVTATVVFLKD